MKSFFSRKHFVVRTIPLILVLITTAPVLVGSVRADVAPGPWSPMNFGFDDHVYALTFGPDGTVYAGGEFYGICNDTDCTYALRTAARGVAQWDGSNWSPVGFGVDSEVFALAVASDGALYAGGDFNEICNDINCTTKTRANYIAKWNGSNWSPVGYGFHEPVLALAFGTDGTLYAGSEGSYLCGDSDCTSANRFRANNIGQWDGSNWSPVGFGFDGTVRALAFGTDGTLYAGSEASYLCGDSDCTSANKFITNNIGQWDGSNWSPVGFGFVYTVFALTVGLDGTLYGGSDGNQLCGDIDCTSANRFRTNYIGQWDGSNWSPAGYGVTNYVYALTLDKTGILYAGGEFYLACADGDCTSATRFRVTHVAMVQADPPPAPPPAKKTSIFRSQSAYDGWVRESSETSGKGGYLNGTAKTFPVGDDAKNRQYRAILSFNTSSLPDNAEITKVILKIKKVRLIGTDPFGTHGKLKVDIRKKKFSTKRDLQLNDFQAPAGKAAGSIFNKIPGSRWYQADLKSAAMSHIDKRSTTQFRLRFGLGDNNDASADYLKFYSGDARTSRRPRLIVEYKTP